MTWYLDSFKEKPFHLSDAYSMYICLVCFHRPKPINFVSFFLFQPLLCFFFLRSSLFVSNFSALQGLGRNENDNNQFWIRKKSTRTIRWSCVFFLFLFYLMPQCIFKWLKIGERTQRKEQKVTQREITVDDHSRSHHYHANVSVALHFICVPDECISWERFQQINHFLLCVSLVWGAD